MKVPVPCRLGETVPEYNMVLAGTGWFKWTYGWEFTEIYNAGGQWDPYHIKSKMNKEYTEYYEIKEHLINGGSLEELGYPLKGTGCMSGLSWRNGKLYADIILSDFFLVHLLVSCNEDGTYDGGDILFPPTPSFETAEKRKRFLLKEYKHLA